MSTLSTCVEDWEELGIAVALRRWKASCRALRAASDKRMPSRLCPGLRRTYQGASCLVILRGVQATSHELLLWPLCCAPCRGREQRASSELPLLPSAVRQTGSGSEAVLAFGSASHGILSTGLCVFQGRAVSEMEKYGHSPFRRQFTEKYRMMALYPKTDKKN